MPSRKIQTGLRLDDTTYAKVKLLSAQDGRTINNFVEYIVKAFLRDYEQAHGPIPIDSQDE